MVYRWIGRKKGPHKVMDKAVKVLKKSNNLADKMIIETKILIDLA